jgi:site-specific DNA recombinase
MAAPLIAYVRVSSVGGRDEEKFRSPADQEDRARSFAASHGYAVSEVVTDLDVSGAVHPRDREGMSYALSEIEAGRAGGLTAYSLDRYSREPAHADELVKVVAKAGGVIIAPDLPEDLDSPVGEFQMGVLMQVARLYRRSAGERLDSARAGAVKEGIFVGSTLPLGYRRVCDGPEGDPRDRRMEIDPKTGPLIAELFARKLTGETNISLARWLAERTGHTWSRTGVRDLLRRDLYYTGRFTNGEIVSDWDSGALVDEADFQAVQALGRSVQAGTNVRGKHLLSGLLFCGSCGYRMIYVRPSSRQSKGSRPRYMCQNSLKCPKRVYVHADLTEAMVVEEAFKLSKKLVSRPEDDVDLSSYEEALAVAERRLEQMLTPESQDALGPTWPATAKARRVERDDAAAALGEARQTAGASGKGRVVQLGQLWDDILDPVVRREALAWHFDKVIAHPTSTRGQRTGDRIPTTPDLEFVVRTTRPWKPLKFDPPTFEFSDLPSLDSD